jgi:hypothetical protein
MFDRGLKMQLKKLESREFAKDKQEWKGAFLNAFLTILHADSLAWVFGHYR